MPDLQIYSLEWCPYCIKAKALLKAKEIPYRETDVTSRPEQAIEMIERSGRNSVPQIFLDDEHIGGYAELAHLTSTGELDQAFGRRPAKLKPVYDVAVIGGGAAGLSAAMYASRKGLSTVLISEDVGGQVGVTRDIFNYPGYDYVTGPDLSERMIEQAAQNPIERLLGEYVVGLSLEGRCKVIELESGRRSPRRLRHHRQRRDQAPAGDPRRGRVRRLRGGVLLHLRRPAVQRQGDRRGRRRQLGVRGGARDERHRAQGLPGDARPVTADQILRDKVATAKHVSTCKGRCAAEIHGAEEVEGLTIVDRKSGKLRRLAVDAVFVEAGLLPNTSFALDLVETNETGEIIVDERGRTGVRGVFAAGDCTTVPDKQIVVAAGDGAKAALAAFEYLVSQR